MPVDEGHADVSTVARRRLRDGQPPLGREGVRARRRRGPRDGDHDEIREADARRRARRRRVPRAMRRLRAPASTSVIRERARAGTPVLGICLGMQLLFEGSAEHEGAAGLGLLPGEVTRAGGGRSCRTSAGTAVALERASRLTDGLGEAAAFYHVHSFVCRPREDGDVVGPRRVRRALRLDRRARQRRRRRSSTRRSPPATGSRCCANFAGARGVILYPAIDILDGKAVRLVAGALRGRDRLPRRPAEAARVVGRGGRALPARRRPRRRALRRAEVDRAPAPDRERDRRAGAVRRRPALAARGARRAAGGRRAGDRRHRRVPRRRLPRRRDRARSGRACSSRSTCAAATSRPRAGRRRPRCRPTTRSGGCGDRGVRLVRLHRRRPRRDARGPGPRRRPRGSPSRCAGASSTRAGSARSTHLRALAELRQVNLAGVIVGKALYEGRFTIAEGQARWTRSARSTAQPVAQRRHRR